MTPDRGAALLLLAGALLTLLAVARHARRQAAWDRHADTVVRDQPTAKPRIPAQRRPS